MLLQKLHNLKLKDLILLYDCCNNDVERDELSKCLMEQLSFVRTTYCREQATKIVHSLEDYKRNIGRHIERDSQNTVLIDKYNDLEDNIAELASFYEIKRKYKPYKIKR